MTAPDKTAPSSHEQAASLIWYVTGALPESERREIQQHLDSCPECRAELESLIALRGKMRNAYAAEPAPSPRAKLTLLERIKSASADDVARFGALPRKASQSPRGGFLGRLEVWSRVPLVPRWAPAAALVLIVVQAGVLLRVIPDRAHPGGDVTTRTVAPAVTRLRAVFDSQASELQIRELLGALGARIVDGPTADGAYVIELKPGDPKLLGEKLNAARARSAVLQSLDLAPP
jgi:anti-sigma factor RsiW